ncbi:hypothetical protein Hdeb2414_s0026g00674321 [Helianthus debilis subsp. tardiflorus]
MLVEERLRSWRDEREESCGGRDERLRKVLGIEMEITLFCGEHVMPCHEHGVGEDGVHDGRVVVLEREPPEERRESKASPSGERVEMNGVRIKKVKKIETLCILRVNG